MDVIEKTHKKSTFTLNKKVNHKLKDNVTDLAVWYQGTIIRKSEQSITIQYVGYYEDFEWSIEELQEDIDNGDLEFVE